MFFKKKQTQSQTQVRVRFLDTTFNQVITALERLERYLLTKEGKESQMSPTAMGLEGDLHDDVANPPTEESYLAELQIDCAGLLIQARTGGDEKLKECVEFFVLDLFKWYGGRKDLEKFDEVERYFVPIISTLTQQIEEVKQISAVVEKYVTSKIRSIDDFTDEEKEEAVQTGMEALIKAEYLVDKQLTKLKEDIELGKEQELKPHVRGSVEEGFVRIESAMKALYPEDNLPLKLLYKVRDEYLIKESEEPKDVGKGE